MCGAMSAIDVPADSAGTVLADDGSKVAKMAHGLLADSSMKIVFCQAAAEMADATEMRPHRERAGLHPPTVTRPGDLEAR